MQNLGGQTKSIMVFSEVAYCLSLLTQLSLKFAKHHKIIYLFQSPLDKLAQITLDTSGAGVTFNPNAQLLQLTCIAVVAMRRERKMTKAQGRGRCS